MILNKIKPILKLMYKGFLKLLILSFGFCFYSCSAEFVKEIGSSPREVMQRPDNSLDSLLLRLYQLSNAYHGDNSCVMLCGDGTSIQGDESPTEESTSSEGDNQTESRDENREIFLMDMQFFAFGTVVSLVEIVVIGTILWPGVGTAVGVVADMLVTSLTLAAIASVLSAKEANFIALQGQVEGEDSSDWICCLSDDFLFSEDVLGANIGYYHNWLISNVWLDYGSEIHNVSTEDIINHMVSSMEIYELAHFYDIDAFRSEISTIYANIQSNQGMNIVDLVEYYHEVILFYLSEIVTIPREERQLYTSDFMGIIATSRLSDENILFLNGMISTYYYSSVLWNLNAIYQSYEE